MSTKQASEAMAQAMAALNLSDEQWDAIPERVQAKIIAVCKARDELFAELQETRAALLAACKARDRLDRRWGRFLNSVKPEGEV